MSPSRKGNNTLCMTSEETERIRQTVKNRLKRCEDLKGQLRETDTGRNLVATASFLADIAEAKGDVEESDDAPVPVYAVGSIWPPCHTPVKDLKPIGLKDLRFETRHGGNVLEVRKVSPVVKGKVTDWAAVEDVATGDVEKLELVLHTTGPGGQRVLEMGERFKIKEPLLTVTEEGGVAIRVFHPTDLVVLPEAISDQEANGATTASQCKDAGNAALQVGHLWQAHLFYSQGIDLANAESEKSIYHDLNRNSAHANLSLAHNDIALRNALAAVTSQQDARSRELDAKAYFRAACAAYALRDFEKAKAYYRKQQEVAPEDKAAAVGVRKCIARLRESETGVYEWSKIRAGLSKTRPSVDVADFTRDTTVKSSPGKGNGLFATRDFAAGDLVLVEKAFAVVWANEREKSWTAMVYDVRDERIRAYPADLSKAVAAELAANPSLGMQIEGMFGDYTPTATSNNGDAEPSVDTLRIHDIVARNAFGAGDQFGSQTARYASTGLWERAAKANHSCIPNIDKQFLGDLMIVRAKVPIAAGEEIRNCYDVNADWEVRSANLERTWGFKCDCALCRAEEADGAEVRKRRRDLEIQARGLLEREDAGTTKRVLVAKVERLAKRIEGTYDEKRYRGLPRKVLEGLPEWVRVAKKNRRVSLANLVDERWAVVGHPRQNSVTS